MFSVILPTLWKLDYREELQKIHDSSVVGELILINNDRKNTPNWFLGMDLKKLIDVRPDENIFVNPAWNLGVRMAKHEHCLLFSDDVVVDSYAFLQQTDEYLKQYNSLIGCSEQCYTVDRTHNFEIVDETENRPFGYGSIMAFRTKTYKPIPECYKIWFGDNIMFRRYRESISDGAKSFKNLGMRKTKTSVSCSSENIKKVCEEDDRQNHETLFSEYCEKHIVNFI